MTLNFIKHIMHGSISLLAFLALVSIIALSFYSILITHNINKNITCLKKENLQKSTRNISEEDKKKMEKILKELEVIIDKQNIEKIKQLIFGSLDKRISFNQINLKGDV